MLTHLQRAQEATLTPPLRLFPHQSLCFKGALKICLQHCLLPPAAYHPYALAVSSQHASDTAPHRPNPQCCLPSLCSCNTLKMRLQSCL
ncbi:hypothetical protein O181_037360 [Austropuccinia psidii MF-1]|uniref:Uncharacterized protein n=1 Tax=Austropuccinia psidii MF-1 TaxID=1389203 RepID=A0A9Q3DAR6_9BASI|nr:hypothetical protein [Austropuccinia psidii MF-1]